jgi:hypothetical protein
MVSGLVGKVHMQDVPSLIYLEILNLPPLLGIGDFSPSQKCETHLRTSSQVSSGGENHEHMKPETIFWV